MRSLRPLALAVALAVPAGALAQTDSAALVPHQMNAAGFIHASKILADYGFLFDGGPLADRIDQFVAMGMPDPREEDLAEVALATTVEGLGSIPAFTVFVTRHTGESPPNLAHRFAAWVDMVGLGRIEESAYRGVKFYGLREGDETLRAKLSDLGERQHLVSIDPEEQHPFAELAVDTLRGENASFAEQYGSQLDAETYLSATFELTEEIKQDLYDTPVNFLALMDHAKLALRKQGEMVRLALDGTCPDEFDAEALKRALVKAFERLADEIGDDPRWGPILESAEFSRVDAVATVSVELPEDMVRELLEDLTGAGSIL